MTNIIRILIIATQFIFSQNSDNDAIALLLKKTGEEPTNLKYILDLAEEYKKNNKYDNAIVLFKKYIEKASHKLEKN